jgi:hypothetical protein
MTGTRYTAVRTANDVTTEILNAAESIFDVWYAHKPRINWVYFLERLDGIPLKDGSTLNLGKDLASPAIEVIEAHIRRYRR